MSKGRLSKSAVRWLAIAGVALLLLSLVLLAYALLPGATPLRSQATLAPTLFAVPTVIP